MRSVGGRRRGGIGPGNIAILCLLDLNHPKSVFVYLTVYTIPWLFKNLRYWFDSTCPCSPNLGIPCGIERAGVVVVGRLQRCTGVWPGACPGCQTDGRTDEGNLTLRVRHGWEIGGMKNLSFILWPVVTSSYQMWPAFMWHVLLTDVIQLGGGDYFMSILSFLRNILC